MSRLMSVAFTEQQVRDRIKTVTRRKGWWEDVRGRRLVQPGDRLTLCRKVMGRKKGEPLVRICEVQVVSVRREVLGDITDAEVALEGFPEMGRVDFLNRFFANAQGIYPHEEITRIEWRYLDAEVTP